MIVSEQPRASMAMRAEDLTSRGVRRVIAVFVETNTVGEWSRERGEWVVLPNEGVLDDPTLLRPVPLRALLDAGAAHEAVIDALHQRNSPRMAAIKAAHFAQGHEQGLKQALEQGIEVACELRGIPFGSAERAQLESLDTTELETVLDRLSTERRWPLD